MKEKVNHKPSHAVKDDGSRRGEALESEIAALFADIGLDSDIAELRFSSKIVNRNSEP